MEHPIATTALLAAPQAHRFRVVSSSWDGVILRRAAVPISKGHEGAGKCDRPPAGVSVVVRSPSKLVGGAAGLRGTGGEV